MKPNIITVSGASAAGKSFFVEKIIEKFSNINEIVGLTTRPIRKGEINGKSGIFMTTAEMEELEKDGELMMIKEFFGNKYAWYKRDFINAQGLKIINISYKSVEELRENGLDIFSIFIRPESEEKLKEMLKTRTTLEEEYEKRLAGYYESERFLKESKQTFDLVFTNHYDEKSLEVLLAYIENTFIREDKNKDNLEIDDKIESLLSEDKMLDYQIKLANELLSEYGEHEKEEK